MGLITRVDDTFTEGSDAALTAHTPDTGTAWTQRHNTMTGGKVLTVSAASDVVLVTGDESNVGASASVTPDPTVVDQDIEMIVSQYETDTGTKPIYCLGRWVDNSNYYMHNQLPTGHASNDKRLYKVVAGAATLLASVDNGGSAPNTYKLELRDATKKVYKDGVEILSSADNAITGVGKWGFGMGQDPAAAVGNHVDNTWRITRFTASELITLGTVALGGTIGPAGGLGKLGRRTLAGAIAPSGAPSKRGALVTGGSI